MTFETIVNDIVTFVRLNQDWAAPIVFLIALGESFCFLSILIPGTAILVGISALLAGSGIGDEILLPLILAAGVGGSVGYAVSFWIGYYFRDHTDKIWPFTAHPQLLAEGKTFFETYGAFGVFLGHFFGPIRAVMPVVAGMFAMRQIPFQIANVLSAFIWSVGVIAPSFYAVSFKSEIMAFVVTHQYSVAAAMFTLALIHAIPAPLFAVAAITTLTALASVFIIAGGDPLIVGIAAASGALVADLYIYRASCRHHAAHATPWPTNVASADHARAAALLAARPGLALLISKFQGITRALVPAHMAAQAPTASSMLAFAKTLSVAALWAASVLAPAVIVHYFVTTA